MKIPGNSHPDLDLKCDFPARETFREALLSRLLALNERKAHEVPSIRNAESPEFDSDARELSDSELEMLAAAQGQQPIPNEWANGLFPPGTTQ